jgi:hypothetical protein
MPDPIDTGASWLNRQGELAEIGTRQLFFIGGAPRSGTTWVQELLDLHPAVSCRGEALFPQDLARQLDAVMHAHSVAINAKNATTFRHAKGYPPPTLDDAEIMLGTAILLAFQRQCGGRVYDAIGEKTPENVFLFPRLKSLFPTARFIGIARDPRDSLSSAWHFWGKDNIGSGGHDAIAAFVEASLPAVEEGLQTFVVYAEQIPDDCRIFTYEQLLKMPGPITAGLCRFLGVSDDPALVAACVEGAAFPAVSGGRQPGDTREGAFHRKGVVGDWAATIPADLAARIVARLDWAYDWFGWVR